MRTELNGGMPDSAGPAGSGKRTEKRKRVGRRLIRTAAAALAACASFSIAEAGEPVWPKPPQEAEMRDGSLEADVSGMDDGYVVVRFGSPKGRVKIGVSYEGEDEVYFDADSDSEFEVIPLNEGAGGYRLSLYESEIGTLYERMGTVFVNERTDASEKAFLAPNAQVRYGRISPPALFAAKTLSGKPDEEVLRETKALMASRFCYDYAKAAGMPKTGVLPDVRGCFESGQGTCGDLAATATALLRSAGVPTKYVEGTADGLPHAWTEVLIGGEWEFYDPTAEVTGADPKTYEAERIY